jgi:hypothetical protein
MRRARGWIGILGVGLVATACASTLADPLGRENSLEETQRRYTQLVRWGEIEKASAFVDEDEREALMAHGPRLESIRFTDYETGTIEYEGSDAATVTVSYRAYSLATALEKEISEKQEWSREPGLKNVWHVRSELPVLLAELKGEPAP